MVELGDFLVEVELLNNIYNILRKEVQVATEVVRNIISIRQQALECKGRYIIEIVARGCGQEAFSYCQSSLFTKRIGIQHLLLGWCQCIREALDNTHGQDDIAIFVRLVSTHKFIGNGPNKVRLLLYIDGCPFL